MILWRNHLDSLPRSSSLSVIVIRCLQVEEDGEEPDPAVNTSQEKEEEEEVEDCPSDQEVCISPQERNHALVSQPLTPGALGSNQAARVTSEMSFINGH